MVPARTKGAGATKTSVEISDIEAPAATLMPKATTRWHEDRQQSHELTGSKTGTVGQSRIGDGDDKEGSPATAKKMTKTSMAAIGSRSGLAHKGKRGRGRGRRRDRKEEREEGRHKWRSSPAD